MNRKEVKKIVIDKIREIDDNILLDEEIEEKKSPDELGLDSLDCVELVMHLEGHFNIAIPDDEIDGMKERPLADFIDYLLPIVE